MALKARNFRETTLHPTKHVKTNVKQYRKYMSLKKKSGNFVVMGKFKLAYFMINYKENHKCKFNN